MRIIIFFIIFLLLLFVIFNKSKNVKQNILFKTVATQPPCNGNGIIDNITQACICNPGWKGSGCQYSDMITCNGKGTVNENGVCSCISGWKGENCQYSNTTTCSGRGLVGHLGLCTCSYGWGGLSCNIIKNDPTRVPLNTCPPGKNGDRCQYSDLLTCSGNGTATYTGTCNCNIEPLSGQRWLGLSCQYSNTTTCNGKGTVDNIGKCTCNAEKGGLYCNDCPDGTSGSSCQYSSQVTCNGKGTVKSDGSCICNSGYSGNRCQHSDSENCNGNGKVDYNGNCTCKNGWKGNGCQYNDFYTCNKNGIVNNNGICSCFFNFKDQNCNNCNNNFIGNKCNYFNNGIKFRSTDSKVILDFIMPGLISISHSLYKTSTSMTNYDLVYSGYYISKDSFNTELFYSVPTNDVLHNNLIFEITLPPRPTNSTSLVNPSAITQLYVKLCKKDQTNCPIYTLNLEV